jgi:gamma-glutamyl-gamma-aminobutyrate hydrolase PuuD
VTDNFVKLNVFPVLWNLDEAQYSSSAASCNYSSEGMLMSKLGHDVVDDIRQADCLVFIGGADINPALYSEPNVASYVSKHCDARDLRAWAYFNSNRDQFKILTGICRGGQFLNAMSGGAMWQDVNGHGRSHNIVDKLTGKEIFASSTHHQMMRPSDKGEIVAISSPRLSTQRLSGKDGLFTTESGDYDFEDIEVVWYPETKSLCFQPHPEYMGYKDLASYFGELIQRYVTK